MSNVVEAEIARLRQARRILLASLLADRFGAVGRQFLDQWDLERIIEQHGVDGAIERIEPMMRAMAATRGLAALRFDLQMRKAQIAAELQRQGWRR
jgi:hypothetical protein